ncbi:F-actin-capping protein subunit alpha [Massospora cicadina]|nr:F-actin-capping protein subunit alpha [Massospora cicadina]
MSHVIEPLRGWCTFRGSRCPLTGRLGFFFELRGRDPLTRTHRVHLHRLNLQLDISNLVDNDELLEPEIMDSLRVYNATNFTSVELPGVEHKVLLTKYNQVGADEFVDPRSKTKFKFNCLSQKVEAVETFEPDAKEPVRLAIQAAIDAYVADHYPAGLGSTFSTEGGYAVTIIGTKLNKKNFWNGRVKSNWEVNPLTGELLGTIHARVHYYEEGNVQLNSSRDYKATLECDATNLASMMVKKLGSFEHEYQSALNEGYRHLNNTAFKGLRRALPVTRSKLDWHQISNYTLSSEIPK